MTFVCTGRSSGRTEACTFTTDSVDEANAHFEAFDHDVEGREDDTDAAVVRVSR